MRSMKTLWTCVVALSILTAICRAASEEWTSHVDASLISDIAVRDGELYIASSGGLLVFDPVDSTFQQFTNTIGLPSNFLTALVFDNDGSLHVGTNDSGIARLDPDAGGFTVTPLNATFHGLSDDRITSLSVWGDTIIYGTQKGAGLIIDGFAGQRFLERDGLPSEFIADVFADGDKAWLATDSGVVFVDDRGFVRPASVGLPDNDAKTFVRDDTVLWVGTADGLARLNVADTTWTADGLQGEAVFSLSYDGQRLWAGTRRYLYVNDGSGWQRHDLFPTYFKYQLVWPNVEVRVIQPMGGLTAFVGAPEPRVLRGPHLLAFDNGTVQDIVVEGPPMNQALRLSFDVDGSLWVSSNNFGVGKLHPSGVWFNYNRARGDENVSSRFSNLTLLADSQGIKWFQAPRNPPTTFLLDRLDDKLDLDFSNDVWAHDSVGAGGGDGLGSLRNVNAVEDPGGNRWFLSDTDYEGWGGISVLSRDESIWRQINPTTTNGGMKSANVIDAVFSPNGDVYIALRNFGVQKWFAADFNINNFPLTGFWDDIGTTVDDFGGGDALALALRSDGVLWVGTQDGIYKYENGFFRHIPANRGFGVGLLSNQVNDLVLDHDEHLWAATSLGVNRIARDDDNDILSFTTPIAYQTQLNLFFSPDIVSPLTNAFCDALVMHPTEDRLFIATGGGVSEFDITDVGKPRVTSIQSAYVYPNPVYGGRGDSQLRIANIAGPVLVEIFTLEGEMVHSYNASAEREVVWNLTTPNSNDRVLASSGVYIVRISDATGSVTQRIALLQ